MKIDKATECSGDSACIKSEPYDYGVGIQDNSTLPEREGAMGDSLTSREQFALIPELWGTYMDCSDCATGGFTRPFGCGEDDWGF